MKPILKSKTLWVNVIAILGIILNGLYGIGLDAETQAVLVTSVLALANIILRFFTSQPIR